VVSRILTVLLIGCGVPALAVGIPHAAIAGESAAIGVGSTHPVSDGSAPSLAFLASLLTDTIRIDTIRRGDSIIRIDTILTGDTIIPRDTINLPDTLTPPIPIRELVVEVLRSPIGLDEAPFAVSVLDHELYTTGRSSGSIEESLQGLPGIRVQNRFNDAVGERISVRGYGSRSEFGVRGVKIIVDGIPATLPDGQATLDHLDLGSLGRVEVLRGPGSALYGNAAGGVLSFETRPPADAPLRQEVRIVHGDHAFRRMQGTTSGRVGDAEYFLNLSRYEFGGYRTHPFLITDEGSDVVPVYGSAVREHLNGNLRFSLLGGRMRLVVNAMELDAEDPGSLTRQQLDEGDRRASPLNVTRHAGKQSQQRQAGLTWEGAIGDREIEVMAYGIGLDMQNPGTANWVDLDRRAGGTRITMRNESIGDEGRLWWAIGFDTEHQRDDRVNFENFDGIRGPVTLDQQEKVSSGAVFIQAMLPINQVLDVLTGLRYDRIRFSASDRIPGDAPSEDVSGARTLDSASPSFGFHASFTRAFRAYVNLTTAFETPTTSELAFRPDGGTGFNPDLEPQVGITTEIGGRGLVGQSLAWELVFFHTTLHNELVPFEVEEFPGNRYFRNTGKSNREGWEMALQYTPNRFLTSRLVLSTNDARFRAFEENGTDYSGNRVPGLAPYKVEGILRLGPGSWFAEVRGEASGSIPGDDLNTQEARSPAYELMDVRAGANEVNIFGLRLSPFIGVTNILDREYNTSVVANALGGRHFEPGPGRSVYFGSSMAVQF
jgi:iron complex outermembrane recepter protein